MTTQTPSEAVSKEKLARLREAIQGLLSKTVDNGCTPEEAASASEMILKLTTKYNLDLQEIRAQKAAFENRDESDDYEATAVPFAWGSPYDIWRRRLMSTLAHHFYCGLVWVGHGARMEASLIGLAHNAEVVRYMFEYLSKGIYEAAKKQYVMYCEEQGIRPNKQPARWAVEWKISFCDGAIVVIGDRLKAMRAAADAQTMALIVVSDKAIADATKRIYPSLTYMDPDKYRMTREAFDAGKKYGESVGLHTGVHDHQSAKVHQLP